MFSSLGVWSIYIAELFDFGKKKLEGKEDWVWVTDMGGVLWAPCKREPGSSGDQTSIRCMQSRNFNFIGVMLQAGLIAKQSKRCWLKSLWFYFILILQHCVSMIAGRRLRCLRGWYCSHKILSEQPTYRAERVSVENSPSGSRSLLCSKGIYTQ